jgi:hypothetical protein
MPLKTKNEKLHILQLCCGTSLLPEGERVWGTKNSWVFSTKTRYDLWFASVKKI